MTTSIEPVVSRLQTWLETDQASFMLWLEQNIATLPEEAYTAILVMISSYEQTAIQMKNFIADLTAERDHALDNIAGATDIIEGAIIPRKKMTDFQAQLDRALDDRLEDGFTSGSEAASESIHQDLVNALHDRLGISFDKAYPAAAYILSMDFHFGMDEMSQEARAALWNFIDKLGDRS